MGATHYRCRPLPTIFHLIRMPSDRTPFGCFEYTPDIPLANQFCCSGPQLGLNSKQQGGVSGGLRGVSNQLEVFA